MPSYERILDSLQEHVAGSPEEKSYVQGYVAGKSKARKEVLWIICACIAILALGLLLKT